MPEAAKPCCGCPDDCVKFDDGECPRFKLIVLKCSHEVEDWHERERPNGSFAFRFD